MGRTKCSEKNLFHCYIVHHTSDIYWPGIETGLLGERLATNRPFWKPIVPFIHASFWYGVLSVSCHKLNVWTTVIFTVTRNLLVTSCQFLSVFAKLQKRNYRFDMTVLPSVCLSACLSACLPACLAVCLPTCLPVYPSFCPSVRMEQLGSHWRECFLCIYLKNIFNDFFILAHTISVYSSRNCHIFLNVTLFWFIKYLHFE
jgi:hypothetical protein